MDDKKFGSRLFPKSVPSDTGVASSHRSRAGQLHESPAATSSAEGCGYLTPCEAAFVGTLVDHLLQVGGGASNGAEVRHNVYFDSALADNWGSKDRLCMQSRGKTMGPNRETQLDGSWTALYRVGIAATDLYCMRVFGRLFDDIPDIDQKGVLRALDSIKLVFQDGSQAGVFFAAVYQTVVKPNVSDSAPMHEGASLTMHQVRSI